MERFCLEARLDRPIEVTVPLSEDCMLMYSSAEFNLVRLKRYGASMAVFLQPLGSGIGTLAYVRKKEAKMTPLVSYEITILEPDILARTRCAHRWGGHY